MVWQEGLLEWFSKEKGIYLGSKAYQIIFIHLAEQRPH